MAAVRGAGIQPIAVHPTTKEVYLLVGQEQDFGDGWYDSGKYAGFGGKIEKGESIAECAVREGYEESMGVLGTKKDLKKLIHKDRLFVHDGYYMYIIVVPYDVNLPTIFNNVYDYINKCVKITGEKYSKGTKKTEQCPHGYFEKRAIKWVSLRELSRILKTPESSSRQYRPSFLRSMYALSHYEGPAAAKKTS